MFHLCIYLLKTTKKSSINVYFLHDAENNLSHSHNLLQRNSKVNSVMSFSLFPFSSELTCHYFTFSTSSTELTHLIGKNPTKGNIECFWKLMAVCLIHFISRWQCFLVSPKGKFSMNAWIFSHSMKPLHSSLWWTVLPLVVSDGICCNSKATMNYFSCWKSWQIVFHFKIFFNNLKNHTLVLISTEWSQVGDGIVNQFNKYFHVKTAISVR